MATSIRTRSNKPQPIQQRPCCVVLITQNRAVLLVLYHFLIQQSCFAYTVRKIHSLTSTGVYSHKRDSLKICHGYIQAESSDILQALRPRRGFKLTP
ncbi:hypothetical protein CDAR_177391 [Caerostris darwini]|uniref:Uncharacterized protein n=1 Tax=Caerostris darwini TaxID=1538125 RepID=A0AAV4P184_9ARAC|nr:hypothetical protein CDAR_177391 [Caerostris darwini]